MTDILSNPNSIHVLSAAFFALVSAVVVGAPSESDDNTIKQTTLVKFAKELLESYPSSSNTANGHPSSAPNVPLSPEADKLSEILVDVLWTIDSELEDASVEEARAQLPQGSSPSTQTTLQKRATITKEQRQGDRAKLVELIRELLVS